MYIYIYTCAYMCIHTYIYIYVCIYMYTHTYIHIYIQLNKMASVARLSFTSQLSQTRARNSRLSNIVILDGLCKLPNLDYGVALVIRID